MSNRKQAFVAGVFRFCKEAGFDNSDALELSGLLLVPAAAGAQIVAKMVLDRREQQVKEAGEFLIKTAADDDEPVAYVTTREELERLNVDPALWHRYKIVDNQATADRINAATRAEYESDVEKGYEPKPTYTLPGMGAKTTTHTTATTPSAIKTTATPAVEIGTAQQPDTTTPPSTAQPRSTTTQPTLASYVRRESEGADPEKHLDLSKTLGYDIRPVLSQMHNIAQKRRAFQTAAVRGGFRFRPGQVLAGGGISTGNPELDDAFSKLRGTAQELERAQQAFVGQRASAGRRFASTRAGGYAPRAAVGRQGRTTASMGPLAGRGEGYQPIGAPPATGQTTLQLKGGTGQVTNPESTQRPGEIRMSNLKPLSDATLTTPTGVQMGTGEYGGKPFNYGGYMSDAGPKEMNVPGGATERQNIAQAPGGGLIGTSPSGGYMIGATEGNKMPLSPTSPQGQQALASAGLGTNTTQGAQRTAATQESGEALPPDPHRRRAF